MSVEMAGEATRLIKYACRMSLATPVQPLEATLTWRKGTDSTKLSSDLHMCAFDEYTHTPSTSTIIN